MRLIFVGPQGSGKGTQAKMIAKRLGLCHVSSGDLLRDVKGDLKKEVDKFLNSGGLVPDDLVVKILKERLKEADCKNGFILDGFPRTASQVGDLRKITNIDKVVEIVIGDKTSILRITGRRNCPKCGAIYNINTSPRPKKEGACDVCGGKLVARKDDNEKALRERLKIYHEETEGILKRYPFMRVNGEQSIGRVEEDILEGVGGLGCGSSCRI